jgi:hypothetical protein
MVMDRFQIQCLLSTGQADLQLDIKKMPGEKGPCFMITENGLFKGYLASQKNGVFKIIGEASYNEHDISLIGQQIAHVNR